MLANIASLLALPVASLKRDCISLGLYLDKLLTIVFQTFYYL